MRGRATCRHAGPARGMRKPVAAAPPRGGTPTPCRRTGHPASSRRRRREPRAHEWAQACRIAACPGLTVVGEPGVGNASRDVGVPFALGFRPLLFAASGCGDSSHSTVVRFALPAGDGVTGGNGFAAPRQCRCRLPCPCWPVACRAAPASPAHDGTANRKRRGRCLTPRGKPLIGNLSMSDTGS